MATENSAKILVAEDEPVINEMLKKYLIKQNYLVSGVVDGRTAYNELKTDSYDVCILDLDMPLKSGVKILNDLQRENEITTAVIVLTINDNISTIIEAMKLGAYNYILKPVKLEKLKIVIEKAVLQRKIRIENIEYKHNLEQKVGKKAAEIKESYLGIVIALASSIEMRDMYTGGHSKRVSEIAYMIGKEMNLDEKKLGELKIGGILHDIGKIAISDNILKKSSKLTDEEFGEIKKHPTMGYNIVKNIPSLESIIPYILYHQEKYDGTGYPEGLKGKDIPIEGRTISVADAFEAMISDRPYRKALPLDMAYKEIISNSGKQFDPDIVKAFVKLWKTNKIKKVL